jgi:hypothetical protein
VKRILFFSLCFTDTVKEHEPLFVYLIFVVNVIVLWVEIAQNGWQLESTEGMCVAYAECGLCVWPMLSMVYVCGPWPM